MRSQALRSAVVRVGVLRLLIFASFFVLAGRAAWLTVGMADAAIDHGNNQTQTRVGVAPSRGLILDRDGHELAITVDTPSVYVYPEQLADPERDLRRLARVLDLDLNALRRRMIGREGFRYVARWVGHEVAERVEALAIAGVGIQQEHRRTYPSGALASTVVGFSNIDGDGVRGVEQMMDEWLKGDARSVSVERDARGQLLANHDVDPSLSAGGDVRLSIDAGLQALAENALASAIEETKAEGGIVVVLDPATGDVLSLAESPSFDPNHFRDVDYASTRSRAFSDALEPGSTFKALLVAAALDAGAIRPDQAFDTGEGELRVPGKTIRDHDPYGVLDPKGILTHSSNIGAVMIGDALGPARYHAALRAFGFGARSGSGFPDESAGILRSWETWKPVDAATHSYGQGVAVTAVQLASAMATLANDGRRMKPRLVVAQRPTRGTWDVHEPVSLGQVVSPESARLTLDLMKGVVSPDGTGRLAGLYGIEVAGKTGTAQKIDPETKRYSQRDYIAWFMAAVPADDPELAIVVAIDEPKGPAHSGGLVAAPIFARVATDHLADLGIRTRPAPIAAPKKPVQLAEARAPEPTESRERSRARRRAGARAAAAPQPEPAATREQLLRAQLAAHATRAPKPTPQVSAAPPPAASGTQRAQAASFSRPAARGGADARRAVMVPDFTGSGATRASALAAREDLDVHVVGQSNGRVIAQEPRPGTIIAGTQRTVLLTFAAATSGGHGR